MGVSDRAEALACESLALHMAYDQVHVGCQQVGLVLNIPALTEFVSGIGPVQKLVSHACACGAGTVGVAGPRPMCTSCVRSMSKHHYGP